MQTLAFHPFKLDNRLAGGIPGEGSPPPSPPTGFFMRFIATNSPLATVTFDVVQEEGGSFNVEARIDGFRVGLAACARLGDRLLLGDIRVDETEPQPGLSWIQRLLRQKVTPRPLRNHGIGRQLLKMVLDKADAEGVQEIYGTVTKEDLRNRPSLLEWYQKNGFDILEPDRECVGRPAKKIVRRRDATSPGS